MGPPEPSAALKLLAACTLARDGARIRDLAAQVDDWMALVVLASRHRVVALTHVALREAGVAVPEPAAAAAMVKRTMRTRSQGLRIVAETVHALAALRSAGIAALMLKGPALGRLAFDDPTLRASTDLDLLVAPAAMPAARGALLAAGYLQTGPASDLADPARLERYLVRRKDLSLEREGGIKLELHCRLANNPHLLDAAGAWANAADAEIAPGVTVSAPAGDELVLYLCLHGARSGWDSLKWLADVAALLKQRTPDELAALFAAARRRGFDRPLGQALLLLDWLQVAPAAPAVVAQARRDRFTRWLFALGRRALLASGTRQGHATRYAPALAATLLWRTSRRARAAEAWEIAADGARLLARRTYSRE